MATPNGVTPVEVYDAKITCLENLSIHHRLAEAVTENRLDAVRMALRFQATWAEIGAAMGMSKAAAHKKFAHLVRRKPNGHGR